MGDTVQEEPTLPAQEIAVDCRSCSALKVPRLSAVVGKEGVCVVEVCYHDEPVGDKKPGDAVEFDYRCQAQ